MTWTKYDTATGRIEGHVDAQIIELARISLRPGQALVDGQGDPAGEMVVDGAIVPRDFDLLPLPVPTPEQLRRQVIAAIDQHVEQVAMARDYNSAAALAGYVGSTVEEWAAEAATFVAWRDAVWLTAYAMLADVQAGERAPPSPDEAVAELPDITWPA